MPGFLRDLFDTGDFMSHGHCYLWNADLIRLHVVSDLAIGLAYLAISLTLLYLVRQSRGQIPFSGILFCFGGFILACGATHFIEIWTLWTPVYWLSGWVKAVTAVVSIATALILPTLVPKVLKMVDAASLNAILQKMAEAANHALLARTVELADANRSLLRLGALVEHSSDSIVSLNNDNCIVSWNPAAERMFGYRMDEVFGRSVSIIEPGEVVKQTAQLIERLKSGEVLESLETIRLRKNGKTINVFLTLSLIKDAAGHTMGVSLIERDTSGLRKRGDEMFRLAVEAAPNAMVMVDGEGKIILVNAQTEKLFGYKREELIGEEVDILVPARYRGKHPANRAKFMDAPHARPMSAGLDLRGRRKDGSEFPVEIGLNPIQTDQETWVLSAIVDITERRRAEELFRLALQVAPHAAVTVEDTGKVMVENGQTQKIFG